MAKRSQTHKHRPKHRRGGKIKQEHHLIEGLKEFLKGIESWQEIHSILPAPIKRTRGFSSGFTMKVQYRVQTGVRCIAQSGSVVQGVTFVATHGRIDALERKLKKACSQLP